MTSTNINLYYWKTKQDKKSLQNRDMKQKQIELPVHIYLIRQFDVEYGWIFLLVNLYFDSP